MCLLQAEEQLMLRVLCHRADWAASKYLKTAFKISKRLPASKEKSTPQGGDSNSNLFRMK